MGTKPKEIDVLIIKKKPQDQIRKNIGRIFKGHNIVEYKSPDDYLSIDDFYKVYGYACFYKADTKITNSIQANDITITFVCYKYPRELIKHLRMDKKLIVTKFESGIYYLEGDTILIQLIITSQLTEETNLCLHNLTNNIKDKETAQKLIAEYGKHKNEGLYKSLMNIIVRANLKKFGTEDKDMCEALMELMADKISEKEQIAEQRGIELEREHSIEVFIADYLSENFSKEKIVKKIQANFALNPEQAEEYFEKYACVTK